MSPHEAHLLQVKVKVIDDFCLGVKILNFNTTFDSVDVPSIVSPISSEVFAKCSNG